MKASKLIVFVLVSGIVSLVNVMSAQAKELEATAMRVEVKCYVELAGGSETISLWKIEPSSLAALPDVIIGHKANIIGGQSSKKKGTIYRVKQCILAKDEFSSPIARAMDNNMLR
jgi:hypothetical protein